MFNYKITLEYEGTNYNGLQIQNTGKTVEGEIVKALNIVCGKENFEYSFCGRTDAGVHALSQVMNVKTDRRFAHPSKFALGLNLNLREEAISAISSNLVSLQFDARFSCISRSYRYIILNRSVKSPLLKNRAWLVPYKLDFEKMLKAKELFIGTHNFGAFRNLGCVAKSPIKTITKLDVILKGEEIWIEISAPSFLYKMVRNIVGALIDVSRQYIEMQDLANMIFETLPSKSQTAPGHGLYFLKADFKPEHLEINS